MITAATDTILEDGRAVCIIRAYQLQPGDIWVQNGRIDLTVMGLSKHPFKDGFVVVHYRIGNSGIEDQRTEVAHSFASTLPRVENGAH